MIMAAPGILKVGWIGTGLMGLPMCSHLLLQQPSGLLPPLSLTVYNRTPGKAQPLVDVGATLVDSPLDLAQRSDVVFTMLTSAADVRQVLLGPSGVLSGLKPGSFIVDCTSSEPSLARELYRRGLSKGVACVDAPVSGGDVGARDATLCFFAGGDEEAVKKLNPLFRCMGKVTYMGPAGSGQTCKLANQISVAANCTGLSEGILYAEKAGLDPELFLKAVSGGAAGSKIMDVYGPKILERDFTPGGFAENMVKDLGTAIKEGQAMGSSFPGLAMTQQLFLSLVAHGDGRLGCQAAFLGLQRLNNLAASNESHDI